MSNERKEYNSGIDLLRVMAMVFIFGIHISQRIDFPGKFLFENGANAVYIFFSLSGYLAFQSLNRSNGTYVEYWKSRCLRIIPSYWLLIILVFIWKKYIGDIPSDSWGIGFARYFLFLQTILPSENFDYWNNMYGLWTMSCFIFFYFITPFLKKYISSLKRAIWLMIICMFLCEITQYLSRILIDMLNLNIDKPDILVGSSPINNLYAFAVGIIAYYIVKDKNYMMGSLISALLLMISQVIGLSKLEWCVISILVIIGSSCIQSNKNGINLVIRFLSKYSFYIYLSHMFVFDIAESFINRFYLQEKLKAVFIFIGLIFLIFLMEKWDKLILRLINRVRNRDVSVKPNS